MISLTFNVSVRCCISSQSLNNQPICFAYMRVLLSWSNLIKFENHLNLGKELILKWFFYFSESKIFLAFSLLISKYISKSFSFLKDKNYQKIAEKFADFSIFSWNLRSLNCNCLFIVTTNNITYQYVCTYYVWYANSIPNKILSTTDSLRQ